MSKTHQTISAAELKLLIESDQPVDLIDVRTPGEYESAHITAARNVPLDTLNPKKVAEEYSGSDDPALHRVHVLYVVCQSGSRSAKACGLLNDAGVVSVSVEGGTPACEQAGVTISRGKRVISLERQVRIGAGSMVLIGVLLAWAVSPWFLVLPGFIGAGLTFAGLTDWCGMGLMLSKMPWNRASGASCGCAVKPVTTHG